MKHNPMGINRGLCSLENVTSQKSKVGKKHKKSCGHFPELLSVEPISWLYHEDKFAITL